MSHGGPRSSIEPMCADPIAWRRAGFNFGLLQVQSPTWPPAWSLGASTDLRVKITSCLAQRPVASCRQLRAEHSST